jgi:hypothetical protein
MSEQAELIEAFKLFCTRYVGMLENARERILFYGGQCDGVEEMERRDPYLKTAREAIAQAEKEPDLLLWYADLDAGVTLVRATTKEQAIAKSGLSDEQLRPFNAPGVIAFTWRSVTEKVGATIERPQPGEDMAAYQLRQRRAVAERCTCDMCKPFITPNGSEPLV